MNECVFIYRTDHIVSQGGLQFYLSEIGRQLVKAPLAAAISPYLISLTPQPMHEMYNETMTLQIDHNTGNYVPYSFRQVCGFPADHVTLKTIDLYPAIKILNTYGNHRIIS